MKVCIASGSSGPFWQEYLIARLAWHWQRQGIAVENSASLPADADLGILHIDRTRLEPAHVPDNPAGIPLLNGRVLDISKRRFSTLSLGPESDWAGAVIVKTDLNAFGIPEGARSGGGRWLRFRRRLAERSWRLARMLPHAQYPVLRNLGEVPRWVWSDRGLIVEKFMPERSGEEYCLRGWVFFGSRGYVFRLFSPDPLVKVGSMSRYEFLGAPPPELEAIRRRHGFDFGKFDYVEHDGRPVLLDANKTPAIITDPDTPRLRHLAGGIDELLRR